MQKMHMCADRKRLQRLGKLQDASPGSAVFLIAPITWKCSAAHCFLCKTKAKGNLTPSMLVTDPGQWYSPCSRGGDGGKVDRPGTGIDRH